MLGNLFILKARIERQRERTNLSLTVSLLSSEPQWPGFCQDKARAGVSSIRLFFVASILVSITAVPIQIQLLTNTLEKTAEGTLNI